MMNKLIKYCGIGLTCLSFNVLADNNPAEALTQALQKIQTFEANFSQRIKDSHGEHIAKTRGKVIIARPNQFYWKSEKPDPVLVVADGKYLWNYDIELAQATKQPLNAAIKNSPATLLAGSVKDLTQDFNVSYAKPKQCKKESDQCFALKPKKNESHFAQIVIGFNKAALCEISMQDALGQDVYTQFSQVKVNGNVDKKLFAFHPPKGVDIIQPGR